MDGSNVSAKSGQKESGFECNVQVQYRGRLSMIQARITGTLVALCL